MKKQLILSTLLAIIILFSVNCKEEYEPPQLNISKTNSSYTFINYNFVNIEITATSYIMLTRILVEPSVENENQSSMLDTSINSLEFSYNYKYYIPDVSATVNVEIRFTAFQEDNQSTTRTISFDVTPSPPPNIVITDYQKIYSGDSSLQTYCYYSTELLLIKTPTQAELIPEKIDFLYYYNQENGNIIASPDSENAINQYFGTGSWDIRNSTRFNKVLNPDYEFFNMIDNEYLSDYSLNPTNITEINNIQEEDIIFFKTENDILGVFRIVRINEADSTMDLTIKMRAIEK